MTAIIGVFPPHALAERSRLFAALGAAFSVRFEGRAIGACRDIDAAIIIGALPQDVLHVPALRYLHDEHVITDRSKTTVIDLADDPAIDVRLRGRRIAETSAATAPERLTDGRPLARDAGGTVWADDEIRLLQTCLVAPRELARDEQLRSRLRPGRFLALLPLIQLLRRAVGYESWSRPSVRAAYLFDDPNLHWPSYGHIRFVELAEHARFHGYHVAFGTIPLDCWFAHPRPLRTFRSAKNCLSLALHGNDHLYQEFARPRSTSDSIAIVAQAIRRIGRFRNRTGLSVDHVVVPPHGQCSSEMMNAMVAVGIEALCRGPIWWSDWPSDRAASAYWHIADIAPSGVPIIGRHRLLDPSVREKLLFDVFLDQPVVLYGHHYDVSTGYDILAETAEWLRGFGEVTWHSLGELARSNYESRAEPDGALRIRSYSRRVSVEVPEHVRKVLFEMSPYEAMFLDYLRSGGAEYELALANGVALAEVPLTSAGQLELRVGRRIAVRPSALPGLSARAVTRRGVAETRDRLQPVVERAGLNSLLRKAEGAYDRRMRARLREQARAGERRSASG